MTAIRRRITSAHLIALLALFVALGGSAYALHLGKNAVKTKNIKNRAVTEAKLADGAVSSAKLAEGAVSSAKIAPGAIGAGKVDVVVRSTIVQLPDAAAPIGIAHCHADEKLLGGTIRRTTTPVFDVDTSGPFPVTAGDAPVDDGEPVGFGYGIEAGFSNPAGGTGAIVAVIYAFCLK
jgi:hypothetical protein